MPQSPIVRAGCVALLIAAAMLAGCASTPQASRERDAEAKNFGTHPGYSTVYIYRAEPESNASWEETVLFVDGRVIGTTLPQTYFRIHLQPGAHVLSGAASDPVRFKLETLPDELYFVELKVSGGTPYYRLVRTETGKRVVRECCAMLENWAPGQRPLLH